MVLKSKRADTGTADFFVPFTENDSPILNGKNKEQGSTKFYDIQTERLEGN